MLFLKGVIIYISPVPPLLWAFFYQLLLVLSFLALKMIIFRQLLCGISDKRVPRPACCSIWFFLKYHVLHNDSSIKCAYLVEQHLRSTKLTIFELMYIIRSSYSCFCFYSYFCSYSCFCSYSFLCSYLIFSYSYFCSYSCFCSCSISAPNPVSALLLFLLLL